MTPVRRYHFHPPGLLYVIVTLFIAIGALNSQNNLLFATLGLAIGGLLASGIVSGAALMGVRVQREPNPPGTAGQPLVLRYTIRNANKFIPVFGLHIEEVVGNPTPHVASPASPTGTHPSAILRTAHSFVIHVGPGESVRASAAVRPTIRGEARSTGVVVWSTFPFGLVRKSVMFPLERTLEIRPAALPLKRGLLRRLSARAAAGVGAERTAGTGEEFFGIREYSPGDNPRRIAWRASARTGDLRVRLHSSPAPIRLWVVLRLGHGDAAEFDERAIALAASLLRHADLAGMAVGLAVPRAALSLPPRADRRRLEATLGALARLDTPAARAAEPVERFPEPASRSGRGALCIVVHAGATDRSFGPRHARHLDAARLPQWVENSEEGRRALALVGPGGAP